MNKKATYGFLNSIYHGTQAYDLNANLKIITYSINEARFRIRERLKVYHDERLRFSTILSANLISTSPRSLMSLIC